ncbi:transposase [Vibrio pectenicida]
MTKRQRRTFSSEFKMDAVRIVLDQSNSIAEIARSIDIGDTVVFTILSVAIRMIIAFLASRIHELFNMS